MLQTLTYIERNSQTCSAIWNCATGTLTCSKGPDAMLNQITLCISTVEKCAPVKIVKQPEHGKASTTRNKNVPPFR